MRRCLLLALPFTAAWLLAPAWAQRPPEGDRVYVYKADGTRHCDAAPGTPLDAMAQELARADVRVFAQRKAHDGREGIAICGNPTGSINVYEIAGSDLAKAFQLDFQLLDPSGPAPR